MKNMWKFSNNKKIVSALSGAAVLISSMVFYSCKGNGLDPHNPTYQLGDDGKVYSGNKFEAVKGIFAKYNCGTCHSAGGAGSAAMDLASSETYGNLIETDAVETPGWKRVVPGEPEKSLLYVKVSRDDVPNGKSRMPVGGVMSEADQQIIYEWIAEGALESTAKVCSEADKLLAANTECCDSTLKKSECYACQSGDELDQSLPQCCDATTYGNWCYECKVTDTDKLLTPLCYKENGLCTDVEKADPLDTLCYDPCSPEEKLDVNNDRCFEPTVSFKNDIYLIFETKCIACHLAPNGPGYIQTTNTPDDDGGFDVSDETTAYNSLVNQMVGWMNNETEDASFLRVIPKDPDNSFLYRKVNGYNVELGDTEGLPMPQSPPPLEDEQINMIRTWIAEGARDN